MNKEQLVNAYIEKFKHTKFVDVENKLLRIPGRNYHIHIEDLFDEEKELIEIGIVTQIFIIMGIKSNEGPSNEELFEKFLMSCEVIFSLYNSFEIIEEDEDMVREVDDVEKPKGMIN